MLRSRAVKMAALMSSGLLWGSIGLASPITISNAFLNLENDNINSDGFATGEFLRFGANSVVPNASNGTTGYASTVNSVTQATQNFALNFDPSPQLPNFFERNISIAPGLSGPYTLNFSNGANSASATVSLPSTANFAPSVQSITLSGTSLNPIFSWTPPPNALVNGYRINIYDKSLINFNSALGPINTGEVSGANVLPSVTSYTVLPADFTVQGNAFTPGKNYTIEIDIIQTKDGTSNNLANANLASISRTYADFTPSMSGGPAVNLPVVVANGTYQFNIAVVPGQTYYIDPAVATGYSYAIGAGDPSFASVVLPTGIAGSFQLWEKDSLGNLVFVADLVGGQAFNFGAGGVSFFEVTGIDPSANLDPNDPTAFVTGLTFTGSGTFDGTQIALISSIPEPTTSGLLGVGLFAVMGATLGKRRRAVG